MFEEIFDVKISKNIFRMFLEQSDDDDGLKKERFFLCADDSFGFYSSCDY